MNAVIYFSCTGHGRKLAENLAAKLGYTLLELTKQTETRILLNRYATAVIVFPVHCQSYPEFMKKFFKEFTPDNAALVAVYGRANAGNAIYEAAKLLKSKIIAAAYVPAEHCYVNDGYAAPELSQEFIDKITSSPSPVAIPKRSKTPFAGVTPSLRSRMLVKIMRTEKCENCNRCASVCPMGAIERGKTNARCVRCLKCVTECPHGALEIKKARILTRYLEKANREEIILYL